MPQGDKSAEPNTSNRLTSSKVCPRRRPNRSLGPPLTNRMAAATFLNRDGPTRPNEIGSHGENEVRHLVAEYKARGRKLN
jgi:hypothetical protein